jgi:predicted  nucleic acid-binding Zn-ribbon protein
MGHFFTNDKSYTEKDKEFCSEGHTDVEWDVFHLERRVRELEAQIKKLEKKIKKVTVVR